MSTLFRCSKIFGKVSSNKKRDLDGLNGYYDTEKLTFIFGNQLLLKNLATCSNMKENSLPAIASKKTYLVCLIRSYGTPNGSGMCCVAPMVL